MINETNWCDIYRVISNKPKLKISRKRWLQNCNKSIQNHILPTIPIITTYDNNDNNQWVDFIKIIHIESQNVFVGIKYGYNQQKILLINLWLKQATKYQVPQDLINLMIKFCIKLEVKSIGFDYKYIETALNRGGSRISITSQQMQVIRKNWITDVVIGNFLNDLERITSKIGVDLNTIKQCFDENDIDYEYFQSHKRQNLAYLLKPYGIKYGPSIKIYSALTRL